MGGRVQTPHRCKGGSAPSEQYKTRDIDNISAAACDSLVSCLISIDQGSPEQNLEILREPCSIPFKRLIFCNYESSQVVIRQEGSFLGPFPPHTGGGKIEI